MILDWSNKVLDMIIVTCGPTSEINNLCAQLPTQKKLWRFSSENNKFFSSENDLGLYTNSTT